MGRKLDKGKQIKTNVQIANKRSTCEDMEIDEAVKKVEWFKFYNTYSVIKYQRWTLRSRAAENNEYHNAELQGIGKYPKSSTT